MVQIGTIEYEAKVTGASDAKQKTDDLQESQEELAETSEKSASGMNRFAGTLSTTSDEQSSAARQTGILRHGITLLSGAVVGVVGKFVAFSGILGKAVAGVKALGVVLIGTKFGIFALAGAIGFALGLIGVWILKTSGILGKVRQLGRWVGNDLPDHIRSGVSTARSIFLGAWESITEGFRFITGGISSIFWGTVDRIVGAGEWAHDRITGVFSGIASFGKDSWEFIESTADRFIGDSVDIVRSGLVKGEESVTWAFGRVESVGETAWGVVETSIDTVIGLVEDAVDEVKNFVSQLGELHDAALDIGDLDDDFGGGSGSGSRSPSSDLGGMSTGGLTDSLMNVGRHTGEGALIGGAAGSFAPGIGTLKGGLIGGGIGLAAGVEDETGIVSGTASRAKSATSSVKDRVPGLQSGGRVDETGFAQVHEGEQFLSSGLVDQITNGDTIRVDELSITIRADSFDPSDLSRRDVEQLADELTRAMGRKTSNIAGTR